MGSWILNNWSLDQAITNVQYVLGDPAKGAHITVKNMKKSMPLTLEITSVSGEKIRKTLPVEIWKNNTDWKFLVETTEAFEKVVVDPDFDIDVDAKNNMIYF